MQTLIQSAAQDLRFKKQQAIAAFLDRDVDRLLTTSAAHHRRLNEVVATLPVDTGLVADEG